MSVLDLLQRVEALPQDEGLDLLYVEVDKMLYSEHPGPWFKVELLFEGADVEALRWSTVIGLLIATNFRAKHKLIERSKFYERCVERARREGEDVQAMLGGLA